MRKYWPVSVFQLGVAMLTIAASPAQPSDSDDGVDLMVIAPHPDDEVLLAGGVMGRATADGKRVAVVLMTNGDFGCGRDGLGREAETIAALATLGVTEKDVHFLGYPDGHLSELGPQPLKPVERRDAAGRCTRGNTTYASYGEEKTDVHSARTGAPAPYTEDALVDDLASLLTRFQPREIYIAHAIDEHPDHSQSYTFFRRALDRVEVAPAVVHRGVVHLGECWPAEDCARPFTPHTVVGALPAPYEAYVPGERVAIEPERKLAALRHYRSQLGGEGDASWLMSFVRKDETFFPEVFERATSGWRRVPARASRPSEVQLKFRPGGAPAVLSVTGQAVAAPEIFEVTLNDDSLELERVSGGKRVAVGEWPMHGEKRRVIHVRVDPRPDEGGYTEWTFYGLDGFIGGAVTPGLLTRVDPQ